ncbi:MAG: prepilin-type N-terminal cleavage/methylation domain-containing protein [Patescibacteria group bacterium]|jgi:type II secretion system protein G
MKKIKGFTLVEIMLVIFIIGLLTTIVSVGILSSQTKSRDAKRKTDLQTIGNAAEMYKTEAKHYLCTKSWPGDPCDPEGVRYLDMNDPDDFTTAVMAEFKKYLTAVPKDPSPDRSNGGYHYGSNGKHFVAYTLSEQIKDSTTEEDARKIAGDFYYPGCPANDSKESYQVSSSADVIGCIPWN